jgi:hypothetical protein
MQIGRSEEARTRQILVLGLVGLVLVAVGVAVGIGLNNQFSLAARQEEVAARGAEVMPFDLARTTHIFEKLDDGGLQTVRADDPSDAIQIQLIQVHLTEEAGKFRQGDFSDPMAIHGHRMPGLAELRAGASRIDVRYTALPEGGQIRYTTTDPTLINGLHRWFDAQLMDHGADATDRER